VQLIRFLFLDRQNFSFKYESQINKESSLSFLKERARERIIFKTLTPNPFPQGEGE